MGEIREVIELRWLDGLINEDKAVVCSKSRCRTVMALNGDRLCDEVSRAVEGAYSWTKCYVCGYRSTPYVKQKS